MKTDTIEYALVSRLLNVTQRGVISGPLPDNAARNQNRLRFNNAIAEAATSNSILVVPPGRYEIHGGGLVINTNGFRWLGTTNSMIVQYQLDAPVVHVGPPLGTQGAAINIVFDGAQLKYAGFATEGGNALEGNGWFMCNFKNIDIGDVYATLANRNSVPWMGVYLDELPGTTPCFSNVFENIRIKHFGFRGWSQYRRGFEAATGNHWSNIYISGGNGEGQQDLSAVNGRAMLLGSHAQCVFNQLNIEWLKAPKILEIEVVGQAVFNSVNIEGVSLKSGFAQAMGFIDLYFGNAVFNGLLIADCRALGADNVSASSVFHIGPGCTLSVDNLRIRATSKSTATTPDFALVRNTSGGGDTDVRVTLQNVSLGDGDQLDRFDAFVYPNGADGALFGLLSDFNNSTPLDLPNADTVHYPFGKPGILRMAPTGGTKAVTLARQCSASIGAQIPRGVCRRVCNSGGTDLLQVRNHDGNPLGAPLANGTSADFAFNGSDWLRAS